jgi:hypothetical protein
MTETDREKFEKLMHEQTSLVAMTVTMIANKNPLMAFSFMTDEKIQDALTQYAFFLLLYGYYIRDEEEKLKKIIV